MIWLIVLMSINGGPPLVASKIPYADMQSCLAEKAERDRRQGTFAFAHNVSVQSKSSAWTSALLTNRSANAPVWAALVRATAPHQRFVTISGTRPRPVYFHD
jgi:hypothetical protein